MASIDKIYATREQRQEFYDWCKANKPEALKYFYEWYDEWNDGLDHPITCFPESIDIWLLHNCHIEWVLDRIREQYGEDYLREVLE